MPAPSGHVTTVKRKKGDVFYLRYRLPSGKHVKKRLGMVWRKDGRPPKGHFTKGQAEAELRKALVEAEEETPPSDSASFGQACKEFVRYVRDVRQIDNKTASDYEGVIDGYLIPEFGEDTPAEEIDADGIEAYRDRLLAEEELSNRTIVRHLTVLHGVLKRAERKGWVPKNEASASMVERPKVVYTGEFDTFERDEVELAAAFADNPQDAAMIRCAAFTGLRQGELIALRWKNVDFVGGLVHVRENYTGGELKIPKGKKVRSVPMMADVVTTLARLKERDHFTGDDDLVFVNETGGYVNHFDFRKRYYAALEAAGLRRIRFHDLRHCFGTATIRELDPFKVQSYMGHQHYSTTQRYLHHKPRREDAEAIGRAFQGSSERVAEKVANQAVPGASEENSEQVVVPETAQDGKS